MKRVSLQANSATRAAGRLPLKPLFLLELRQRDAFHSQCIQTGNQKGRREPLAIDLSVELVGRLVDVQLLQHSRKLFVADAVHIHFFLYQLLRFFFPPPIGLGQQPATLAPQFFHRFRSTWLGPQFFWCRDSLMGIFGRIRPTVSRQHYTFSASQFCEDRMPTKSLQTTVSAQLVPTASPKMGGTGTPSGGAK